MTITTTAPAPNRGSADSVRLPLPLRPGDDAFVGLAAEIGAVAARHSAEHDRDGTFVDAAYSAMRSAGYIRLAVPEELGGLGASMRQVCYAQAELARHDPAASLASTMHLYQTLAQVYRWKHGAPDAEGVLRRIATEDLILATSGGSDWLWVTTTAEADESGENYRINGRKMFCSQAPAASVVSTCAVLGEPGEGAEVLHFAVPLGAPGVRMEETWDTLGMRGTASHDLVLEDVVVPAERIVGRRPWGEFGVPLTVAALHFAPVGGATYYGIAAAARDYVVAEAAGRSRGTTGFTHHPRVLRQVGLMDAKLRVAWWGLMGSLDEIGDDYTADAWSLSTLMQAKRHAVLESLAVVDLAMETLGGRSYFRRCPLERLLRDVRAGTFHPFTPEVTLTHAGKLALGQPTTTE